MLTKLEIKEIKLALEAIKSDCAMFSRIRTKVEEIEAILRKA